MNLINLHNVWSLHLSIDNPLDFHKIVIFDSEPTIERSLIVDPDFFVNTKQVLYKNDYILGSDMMRNKKKFVLF